MLVPNGTGNERKVVFSKSKPRALAKELGIEFTPNTLVMMALSGFLDGNMEINYKTASYTLLPKDNGKVFTTKGATQQVNFTLPPKDSRWMVLFVNSVDYPMTVCSNGNLNDVITLNEMTADRVTLDVAGHKIGVGVLAFCDGEAIHAIVIGTNEYHVG